MNASEKAEEYLKLSKKYLEEGSTKAGIGYALLAQATIDFYLNKNKLNFMETEE